MQLQPPSECQTDADGNLGSFLGHVWCSALCNRGPVLHPALRQRLHSLRSLQEIHWDLNLHHFFKGTVGIFFLTQISTVQWVCLTTYVYRSVTFCTFRTSIHHFLSPLAQALNPLPAVWRWQQVTAWTSGHFTAGPTHKLPSILTSAHNYLQAFFKSLTLAQTSQSLTVTSHRVTPHR